MISKPEFSVMHLVLVLLTSWNMVLTFFTREPLQAVIPVAFILGVWWCSGLVETLERSRTAAVSQ